MITELTFPGDEKWFWNKDINFIFSKEVRDVVITLLNLRRTEYLYDFMMDIVKDRSLSIEDRVMAHNILLLFFLEQFAIIVCYHYTSHRGYSEFDTMSQTAKAEIRLLYDLL